MDSRAPRRRFWVPQTISLRLTVLMAYLLIYVPTVGVVILYNHFENRRRAEVEVIRAIDVEAARIVERQQWFFRPGAALADIWARRMSVIQSPVAEAPRNLPVALEILERNPQYYSLLVGTGSGELFQVSRVLTGGDYGVSFKEIPRSARYQLWLIGGKAGAAETRQFFDDALNPILTRTVKPSGLLPYTRPWYTGAQSASGVAVEGPFIFASGGRLGMTFSEKLQGKRHGAAAVSVLLDDFTAFLRHNRVGTRGISVLFNQQRQAIAVGDGTGGDLAGFRRLQDGGALPSLADSSNPVLSALATHVPVREEQTRLRFSVHGAPYSALIVRLPEPFQGDVYLGLIASMDEFLAPVDRGTAVTAGISMAIGLAGLPLIFWLSIQISRPVRRLSGEARRIARLELSHVFHTRSSIAEVRELFDAFSAMRSGLTAFTKFVPRAAVEGFLKTQVEPVPGGEARNISILFTDVQDFTRLSEGMPPRDLFRKATTYFDAVGSPILASGGVIGGILGDGIVAFWNAPKTDEAHSVKAAQGTLLARARSEALNRHWASFGWPVMHTRFGLHVGDAVVGNVGLPDRLQYGAYGESLNLASRLEGLNKFYGTQILISEAVTERLPDAFVWRYVDRVMPKGTSIPLGVCELIGMKGDLEEIAPTQAGMELADIWSRQVIPEYRARDFARSLRAINDCLRRFPGDSLARHYAERCQGFLARPPAQDWNGVVQYTDK